MKTFKYIALAALVSCGQQAMGMSPLAYKVGMGAAVPVIKNVNDFNGTVTSLIIPLDKFLTPNAIESMTEFNAFFEIFKIARESIMNYLSSINKDAIKNSADKEQFLKTFSIYDGMVQLFNSKYTTAVANMTYTNEKNRESAITLFKMFSDDLNKSVAALIKKFALKVDKTSSMKLGTTQHSIIIRSYKQ